MGSKKHVRNNASVRNTREACSAQPARPVRTVANAHMHALLHNLRLVRCVVSVSAEILSCQRCDFDEDVATVLRRSAADPLDAEIERMEKLLSDGEGEGRHTQPTEPGSAA